MIASPPTRPELFAYRICRILSVGLSRLYFPGTVTGRENLPASGAFIVAPVHRSYVDWLLVARITRRRLRYIVKEEVWKSRAGRAHARGARRLSREPLRGRPGGPRTLPGCPRRRRAARHVPRRHPSHGP